MDARQRARRRLQVLTCIGVVIACGLAFVPGGGVYLALGIVAGMALGWRGFKRHGG